MSAESLHVSSPASLARVAFVLVRPSHPGNVGACARAMRVMGLRDLSIVAPRHGGVNAHAEAIAFASNALDVLESARSFDTLASALADATLVIGVSAEAREFAPSPREPETAAREALDELDSNDRHRVAFVFGTERTGLSIAESQRCQSMCAIPGETGYHSLNLSQAVQVIAYVLRREALARGATGLPAQSPPVRRRRRRATPRRPRSRHCTSISNARWSQSVSSIRCIRRS